ncbi:MAG: VWA domain-containing protein [Kiritimatiellaeota bacterium]|nr:VWA domain-containing protein [Kiritimatiellota bacterium]
MNATGRLRVRLTAMAVVAAGAFLVAGASFAAGTLTPAASGLAPLTILDHRVEVTINNGFAMTRVSQRFSNPNDTVADGMYAFPLPKGASLSEVQARIGEKVINGEVLPKDEARKIYGEERDSGNQAALAEKDGFMRFEFRVANIPPAGEVDISFVYYQALTVDTGVGRYMYPLEEGGTDSPAAQSFWTRNETVAGPVIVDVVLKSAWPVAEVRVPGAGGAQVTREDEGTYRVHVERTGGALDRDFVLYYRLADNLPGRIEVIPYRVGPDKPGTFMMVVTPGVDLKPLANGADFVFVLDVSGSMAGKLKVLADGVCRVLGQMSPADRYRIVTFNNTARVLVDWQSAQAANVQSAIAKVKSLQSRGGTNVYAGLRQALAGLDADRATSLVLVTDGVTNTGVVDPRAFYKLMKTADVRVFGFLMGNSANWPLMKTVCDASGGFYTGVSNSDDIIGQILLAKSKITYECMHDAKLRIRGVKTFDANAGWIGKIYRGQQLVILGRYEKAGAATVELEATITGEKKVYSTTFDFPEVDTDNPELERIWAMHRADELARLRDLGLVGEEDARGVIRELGTKYQIVTDETSMVVLTDGAFQRRGIQRRNRDRIAVERKAQQARAVQPVRNYRVDRTKPAFHAPTPSLGGGGALDPVELLLISLIAAGAVLVKDRFRRD